jgi:hypothetical protein
MESVLAFISQPVPRIRDVSFVGTKEREEVKSIIAVIIDTYPCLFFKPSEISFKEKKVPTLIIHHSKSRYKIIFVVSTIFVNYGQPIQIYCR